MRRLTLLITAILLLPALSDARQTKYKSYKDIPGVTREEINAVKSIRNLRENLTFGYVVETEAQKTPVDEFTAFTFDFFSLLSSLFGIEFVSRGFDRLDSLKNGLDRREIDFTTGLIMTPGQKNEYHASVTVVGRYVHIFTHKDFLDIKHVNDIMGRKAAFLEGGEVVIADHISHNYPGLFFKTVEVSTPQQAASMIRSGEAEMFLTYMELDRLLEENDFLRNQKFFKAAVVSASLVSADDNLAPVISIVNKYINGGGAEELFELHRDKKLESLRRKLFRSFTEAEAEYIEKHKRENAAVDIGLQHDAYPANFYNKVEEQYQGIAQDILDEITRLTGLKFEMKTVSVNTPLAEIMAELKAGEISMMTQLLYSESRKDDYIWSGIPYLSTNYALISKREFPNVSEYQIHYYRVGTINRSVHEEMFNLWYPDHKKRTVFASANEAFAALEKDEVDLLMLSENMLWAMTHYNEKTGFKVSVSFDAYQESRFGYNKSEELLRSIVDKTMRNIDIEGIREGWLRRTFDYSRKLSGMRLHYTLVFALGAVITLIILFFMLTRNIKLNRRLREQADYLKASKEKAHELSDAKSMFLANMSHEMRTPMNAITGMADLLINEQLTERQQGYVKDINTASHLLLSIINDILDLSKIEAGKFALNPIDYDFDELVSNIGSTFKFMARKKNLDFKYEKHGEMPTCLYGDDLRLKQALMNICSNAVKFTNVGFVRLKVTADDETLIFEIKDTGPGIRKEDIEILFSPFVQIDTKKNRNITGTGLGLSISKNFIEMMGGRISVESVYGKGSAFTVIIPKIIGTQSNIVRGNDGSHGKKVTFRAPAAKVLLVDDNPLNLKVASGLLGLYGISADTATSGSESILAVNKAGYDIVFMDHMMPEMDGVEAAAQIRVMDDGKHSNIIIVALTANAIHGSREMFLQSGFNDYVAKPIELDKLSEVLRKWIPAEKIEEHEAAHPALITPVKENESVGKIIDAVSRIDSINIEIGMERVSGIAEMYSETLRVFYNMLPAECKKMESFLQDDNIINFAISIHGMKSSLATIGAMELSNRALELEFAAKSDKLEFCREAAPSFLRDLRVFHSQLSNIFKIDNVKHPRPKGENVYLCENVKRAIEAAQNYDGDLGLKILDKLLMYDYDERINEALIDTQRAFKEFDFEAAADFLVVILN
ncbi:MAG: transporter substrate-binding domain-containing protein [Chitinispirillales bacterium]|jgi:signal transduction histidine kinase/FixJ family two-component response regulator/HPt (histidine-containing phosphotransfer) domain-containing protein|nr:transporter substrate-binding domain-containing protein [Chitinispirillales bacterium]